MAAVGTVPLCKTPVLCTLEALPLQGSFPGEARCPRVRSCVATLGYGGSPLRGRASEVCNDHGFPTFIAVLEAEVEPRNTRNTRNTRNRTWGKSWGRRQLSESHRVHE